MTAAALAGNDSFIIRARPDRTASSCVIVTVSDEDIERRLNGKGEICFTGEILATLINRILRLDPLVVAVDIDTSSSRFRSLPLQNPKQVPIVWARDVRLQDSPDGAYRLAPQPVLGGEETRHSGLPLYPPSGDQIVRAFQRQFWTTTRPLDSFHWAILEAACARGHQTACTVTQQRRPGPAPDHEVLWFLENYRIDHVLAQDLGQKQLSDAQNLVNPLFQRIVILGGSDGDEHETPFGVKIGAELASMAVETELAGLRMEQLSLPAKLGVKISLAAILILLYHWLRPRWAFWASLVLAVAVTAACFFSIYRLLYQVDFVSFLVGMLIEQLYESSSE